MQVFIAGSNIVTLVLVKHDVIVLIWWGSLNPLAVGGRGGGGVLPYSSNNSGTTLPTGRIFSYIMCVSKTTQKPNLRRHHALKLGMSMCDVMEYTGPCYDPK